MAIYKYDTKEGTKYLFKISLFGKQFLRRGFNSKEAAIAASKQFLVNFGNAKEFITFNELLDAFINYKKDFLKPTTFYNMNLSIEKHIRGHIPNKAVNKINYNDLYQWRNYIINLDLTYKKRYYILINQIFRFCNDFFDYDCKAVKMLPPFKSSNPDISLLSKEKYITYEDFKKFIKACETRKLRVLFILTYFTGLRLGEVLGLQKQCYDASTKTLYIYQSLTNKTGTRKSVLLSPKSKESIRKYYLPEFLSEMLEEYIKLYINKDTDFIFKISRSVLSREINRICEKAKIEKFHFHQLRSTDTTMLFELGIPIEDISKYLGHTSINTTKKHYLELTDSRKQNISNVLQEHFSKDFDTK